MKNFVGKDSIPYVIVNWLKDFGFTCRILMGEICKYYHLYIFMNDIQNE